MTRAARDPLDLPATLCRWAAGYVESADEYQTVIQEIELTSEERAHYQGVIYHLYLAARDTEDRLPRRDLDQARADAQARGDVEYVRIFDAELQRRGLAK